ncbi:DNA-binding CsgD family transcriptional regulator [Actinoplanes tereljensis]|uniref:LuxR family transcriptional regulator n=1 Tax=Paractinoplanes tereljensis TaxID=571912 RepID=A0A919NPA9_9ACTN|nr:helix-turn-helix transcriptional regulator [Actinoplanes tereljensis]GIF22193.1 LuxR family transcriptional regulator [Actinoplanes tereljensis]
MTSEILGRDTELAALTAFRSADGGGALVVRGDAGVGKSVLLDAVATAGDRRVLRAVGTEAEFGLAYAGLHQMLYPLLPHASSLDPPTRTTFDTIFGRGSAEPPSVLALGVAVLDLLALAAGTQPLLLVVDDAHWLDPQSVEVGTFIARRLSGHPVRLLVAVRSEVSSAWDVAGLPSLSVPPLAAPAAKRLLESTAPGLTEAARDEVLREADGNPLALVELPRAAAGGIGMPLARRLFGARIEALSRPARQSMLRAALDSGSRYRLDGVADAIASGLVTGDLAFRHPLVRSALLGTATPNERRAAHRDLSHLYELDAERYATHLAAATVDPDEEVAESLELAARSASERGGAASAVAMLTRAAELSPDASERSRRLEEAAFVASQAALLDRAGELRSAAGAQSPGAVLTEAYAALYRDGDVRVAHRRVATALAGDVDAGTRERLLGLLLAISLFAGDEGMWHVTEEVFAGAGDLSRLYRDVFGDIARTGQGAAERVREAFGQVGEGQPWDVMRLGVAAYYTDCLAEHRALVRRVADREEHGGAVSNAMTLLQLVMLDQMTAGEWDDALATGRRGLELTIEHGFALFEHQFYGFSGLTAAWRGDFETARRAADRLDRWARPRGVGYLTELAEAIGAAAAMTAGDYEEAYAYASGLTAPGTFTPYSQLSVRTLLDLVEAAVHTGRTPQADAHVAAAVALDLPAVSGRLAFLTVAARAVTSGSGFEAAVAHPAAAQFPFERARVLLAQGMWLRRQRDRVAARTVLSEAAEAFERLGTEPWAARARSELRAAGSGVLAGGADGLTAQEREIAALAAGGLSNKEIGAKLFLSPRTVGAHLYRVFPKLGISSRASLRDALTEN